MAEYVSKPWFENTIACDPTYGAEEGSIVIPYDKTFDDVYTFWTDAEINSFIRKCGAYLSLGPKAPVGVLKYIFKKPIVMEAISTSFTTLSEMANFLKDDRGLLIYQIYEIDVDKINGYVIRSFTSSGKPVCINWFTYMYNKLFNKHWKRG